MYKCSNKCPVDHSQNSCCRNCPQDASCQSRCPDDPETCVEAIKIEDQDEDQVMIEFQNSAAVVFQSITQIIGAKKELEAQEAILKDKIKTAMEAHGIKSFKNEILNLTYVAETTSTSIDSAKLKKKYPDIAEECSKTSKKSSYVKITLKGEKE